MKISVVMIVKNEEVMLPICLNSVQGADEIVICDTGSTDRTVEIAKQFTDKIVHFRWCDDFSRARNFAKSHATNDWVLSIDADEELSKGSIEHLKSLPDLHPEHDAFAVTLTNEVGHCNSSPRFFKSTLDFASAIHESVTPLSQGDSNAVILYKTSPAHLLDPDLDLRIMQREFEKEPNNTRNAFYLGREYYYYKRYEEAEKTLEHYISLKSTHNWEVTYAYYLLAKCYWLDGKGNGEKARERCGVAIARNPNFKSALLLMADMHYGLKARWQFLADTADNSNLLFIDS